MTTTDATTVSVSTEVDAPIARAFHVFTAEIGTWWDTDKHILDAPLAEMVFEPFVGGNIIDRGVAGGTLRPGVTPDDIVVFGAMLAQPRPADRHWDATCRRLLATYIKGLGGDPIREATSD